MQKISYYTRNNNIVLHNETEKEIIVCSNAAFVDLEHETQAQLVALWDEMQDLAAAYTEGYSYFKQL